MSPARNRTFERMGIVLRRSTTRCTWPRDFNKAARSRVTFMGAVQSGFCSIHHARPLPFGDGDGLWRGFRQIASRRDESTGAFARARALAARGTDLYLPLIRRI